MQIRATCSLMHGLWLVKQSRSNVRATLHMSLRKRISNCKEAVVDFSESVIAMCLSPSLESTLFRFFPCCSFITSSYLASLFLNFDPFLPPLDCRMESNLL